MPAFTEQQIRRCHEIARVILADTAKIHNGFGIVLELSNLSELSDALDAKLADINSNDTDSRTEIQSLITQWDNVRLATAKIEGGSVGDLSSVSFDFEEARTRIKELFQIYVPFMHHAEAIVRRANEKLTAGKSANLSIARL